jgi:hypothetical protein
LTSNHEAHFWYQHIVESSPDGEMPPQALPDFKKNKQWTIALADFMEREGTKQIIENTRFRDFYRMVEGKLSYQELSEVVPQLKDSQGMLGEHEIPSYIKHYDLIGVIVNAMVGELLEQGDKFHVTNNDEIGTNEYQRQTSELLWEYIGQEWEKEFKLMLLKMGVNADMQEFSSEEEKQQHEQQIASIRNAKTPPEIKNYMTSSWKTKAIQWAEYTLEADKERFDLSELDREEFKDYLLTGRCFRHYRLGYDYYEPESWSPLNTFFSQDVDSKKAEDQDYIGRMHYFTPAQVIDRYGHLLTANNKEGLNSKISSITNGGNAQNNGGSAMNIIENNFGSTHQLPYKNYYENQLINHQQDVTGQPAGMMTTKDGEGNSISVPSFFSRENDYANGSHANGSQKYAKYLRDDLNLRKDLIQVTEGYCKSYTRIGYMTYYNTSGQLTRGLFTDDLLPEILRENGITKLKSVTIEEHEADPKVNTIVYDYIPQYYTVLKINKLNCNLDDDIYDIKKMDFQIRGNSELYQVKAPVVGIIEKTGLGTKVLPYQVPYNVSMNQMMNLLEKEIGLFYLFDVGLLPSEFKNYGDTGESMLAMREYAKDIGLFPIDNSQQNTRSTGNMPLNPVNMSLSTQIADRMRLAEFFMNKAFEQVGITPERLGSPVSYQTAEGVKASQSASFSQTEAYFHSFSIYKKRAYEIHLNVAQYAQTNDKDITVYYTKSDDTQAFLKFSDKDFHLRKFGIMPQSNSKKRKELEVFKSYLQQNNTMGVDELSFAKLIGADTMTEATEFARQQRETRTENEQVSHKRQLEILQKESDARKEEEIEKFGREEQSKELDRKNAIKIEYLESLGRAADSDTDQSILNYLKGEADIALKTNQLRDNQANMERKADFDDSKLAGDNKFKERELTLKEKELEERAKTRRSNEFQSIINKN